jgi:hypothetical protein
MFGSITPTMWKVLVPLLAVVTVSLLSPLGGGSPVSVTETVEGDYEYVESNDSIRYPAYRTGRNEYIYGTVPFDEWSGRQCATIAGEAAVEAVEDRYGDELRGVSGFMTVRGDTPVAGVEHSVLLNREGELKTVPNIEYSRLNDMVPKYVNVNARYANLSWSCRVPVVVRRSVGQEV